MRQVNTELELYLSALERLKKPFMHSIIKEIQANKIVLVYPDDMASSSKYIYTENGKVYVDIRVISKNFDDDMSKGRIDMVILYSYVLQAYAVLYKDKLESSRDIRDSSMRMYTEILVNALTSKRLGTFRNVNERKQVECLLTARMFAKYIDDIEDIWRAAGRFTDCEYWKIYKDKYDKSTLIDDDVFLINVLGNEFPWMDKFEKWSSLAYMVLKNYGPLAYLFVTTKDISYYLAACVDCVQTARPTIYKQYVALTQVISSNNYKEILDELSLI